MALARCEWCDGRWAAKTASLTCRPKSGLLFSPRQPLRLVRMLFLPARDLLVAEVGRMHIGKGLDRQPKSHHLDHWMITHSVLVWHTGVIQQHGGVDRHVLIVSPQFLLPVRLIGWLARRVPDVDAERKVHDGSRNVLPVMARCFGRTYCL